MEIYAARGRRIEARSVRALLLMASRTVGHSQFGTKGLTVTEPVRFGGQSVAVVETQEGQSAGGVGALPGSSPNRYMVFVAPFENGE